MKYRIGICDDELSVCSELENYISELFDVFIDEVEIFVWNTSESFRRDVPSKTTLDILFLDIELPDGNGVALAKYIRDIVQDSVMKVIFISSKTSYAMELFDMQPFNFLVKPLDKDKIYCDINKILSLKQRDSQLFSYVYNKVNHHIPLGNIYYFEGEKHYINIIGAKKTERYIGKLKEEIKRLPNYFAMINQSCIVNIRQISECSGEKILMNNGVELTVSRSHRKEFNKIMLEKYKERI